MNILIRESFPLQECPLHLEVSFEAPVELSVAFVELDPSVVFVELVELVVLST